MHHPQLSHLISNNGGTLPRSSPRKLILDGADKSATLTRQQSKQKSVSALAKVASSVELAVMGYNNNGNGNGINGSNINIAGNSERDRCINAVIVSPGNICESTLVITNIYNIYHYQY